MSLKHKEIQPEQMANAKTNVSTFPALVSMADEHAERRKSYSWPERRLLELGIYAMATDKPNPPGLYVNFSTASFFILVLGTMAGLWWFTWQTAEQQGYQRGQSEAERQHLLRQIEDAKRDAAEAKKLQTYSAGVADTHGQEKPKEKK